MDEKQEKHRNYTVYEKKMTEEEIQAMRDQWQAGLEEMRRQNARITSIEIMWRGKWRIRKNLYEILKIPSYKSIAKRRSETMERRKKAYESGAVRATGDELVIPTGVKHLSLLQFSTENGLFIESPEGEREIPIDINIGYVRLLFTKFHAEFKINRHTIPKSVVVTYADLAKECNARSKKREIGESQSSVRMKFIQGMVSQLDRLYGADADFFSKTFDFEINGEDELLTVKSPWFSYIMQRIRDDGESYTKSLVKASIASRSPAIAEVVCYLARCIGAYGVVPDRDNPKIKYTRRIDYDGVRFYVSWWNIQKKCKLYDAWRKTGRNNQAYYIDCFRNNVLKRLKTDTDIYNHYKGVKIWTDNKGVHVWHLGHNEGEQQ